MADERGEVDDVVEALAELRRTNPERFEHFRSLILGDQGREVFPRPGDCEKVSQSD